MAQVNAVRKQWDFLAHDCILLSLFGLGEFHQLSPNIVSSDYHEAGFQLSGKNGLVEYNSFRLDYASN